MRHRLTALPRLFLLLLAAACSTDALDPGTTVADLSREWTTASAAAVGLDAARLDAAVQHATTLPRVLSLLVARHGQLAIEAYFNGNTRDSLNDVRSVTKSIVSTLTGIAADRGALGIDSPIGPFLDSIEPALAPEKRAIRVRDLLTMRSGFDWHESGAVGYNEWVLSGEPIHFLLDKPLAATPGQTFTYNSAAAHLLSVVVQQAVGQPIPEFAQTNLFTPLGITRERWEGFPDGRVNGGAGIDLRPRDLAKVGQVSYGWLWWLAPPGAPSAFFAWGHGGQFIWVVPGLDAVIVVTTDWRAPPVPADELVRNAMDLIVNWVLPAFD